MNDLDLFVDSNKDEYILSDGEIFRPSPGILKEAIEFFIVSNPGISLSDLKMHLKQVEEISEMLSNYRTLIQQYHLYQHCRTVNTNLNLNLKVERFLCRYINNTFKLGDFYVPHFYCYKYNVYKDSINRDFILTNENSQIISLLDNLPIENKSIHVGFLTHREVFTNCVLRDKYEKLIMLLSNKGYALHGNIICNCYDGQYKEFVLEEDFIMSNFMWDDSITKTITVLIDIIGNDITIEENIKKFISMDNGLRYPNIAGRLIYISIFYGTYS